MDKNAIKKYAIWAREELIRRVSTKTEEYGISKENVADAGADSVNGRLLTKTEKAQRQRLIAQIKKDGYEQVVEEVAYTWFNRFIALRFMEVNNYLPSHVRVFTDENNDFRPQILTEALHLELDGLDMDKVIAMKQADDNDGLYKYLLITQCNALSGVLPRMFQKIEDYTELLFPDNILREGSVIYRMVSDIPEDNWTDQVQIIGWLYQYYNTAPKDKVFANLKKNIKISKENIPAATQLFTPDWIVRYMVENSLGRLWVEGHPNDAMKANWKYYIDEAEQEPEVKEQLERIRAEYRNLKPEEIKVIDPCMGSGHILVYLFDVLMQIYDSCGYSARDAVRSILENNLYGLDIDDRAEQLAYFSVMMKARKYDRRFFAHPIQPNVYAIQESNWIGGAFPFDMGEFLLSKEHQETLNYLIDAFEDAMEYGSILKLEQRDYAGFIETWELNASQTAGNIGLLLWYDTIKDAIPELAKLAIALTQKYHAVCTNPPYMTVSNASVKVQEYVKKNYPDSKSDLFAVFIERCGQLAGKNCYQAIITQQAWMFLSSFEKLRAKLQTVDTVNMAHLGPRAFEEIGGEVVQTTSFVMRRSHINDYKGTYCRLIEPNTQQGKENMFLAGENRYTAQQDNFSKIPGSPVAYWVSSVVFDDFRKYRPISCYGEAKAGMTTGDNETFLRLWHEVFFRKIGFHMRNKDEALSSQRKWFPYNKGGGFCKWYGLNEHVVLWENDGYQIKNATRQGRKIASVRSERLYFMKSITWATLTSSMISARSSGNGFLFDDKGSSAFVQEEYYSYVLSLINSCVGDYFLHILNPTMSFQSGNIGALPVVEDTEKLSDIDCLTSKNVDICKSFWDSFETSWDFTSHPLVRCKSFSPEEVAEDARHNIVDMNYIEDAFTRWSNECYLRFNQLKANEEELNRIFIDIYGLQDELTPEVEDKDVTVRKADLGRDIRSFISYAVGCMFGRYSLYKDGLIYAGGKWDYNKYVDMAWLAEGKPDTLKFYINDIHFYPDQDNIIPICDDEYFADDIVGLFVQFVSAVYGSNTLAENLKFIADALGGKGNPLDVIRSYFLNDFYADHCKIYQKRPIYWLFDSGKKNGFKALIYMHRYQPDLLARMRTDYVHEQQARYRTAIDDLERRIAGASTSERVKLNKQLNKLKDQDIELRSYEEKVHHLADQMIDIDLDDGVKVNYAKFQDVLAKIK